jgi:hypothetical protein
MKMANEMHAHTRTIKLSVVSIYIYLSTQQKYPQGPGKKWITMFAGGIEWYIIILKWEEVG